MDIELFKEAWSTLNNQCHLFNVLTRTKWRKQDEELSSLMSVVTSSIDKHIIEVNVVLVNRLREIIPTQVVSEKLCLNNIKKSLKDFHRDGSESNLLFMRESLYSRIFSMIHKMREITTLKTDNTYPGTRTGMLLGESDGVCILPSPHGFGVCENEVYVLDTKDISIPIHTPTFKTSFGMATMYTLKVNHPDYHLRLVGEADEK